MPLRFMLLLGLSVTMCCLMLLSGACRPGAEADKTPEYMLASLDAGRPLAKTDPSIAEYAVLLDRLEARYANTRIDIADKTVKAQELLARKSESVTLIEFLRFMDTVAAGAAPNDHPEYGAVAASCVTLIEAR